MASQHEMGGHTMSPAQSTRSSRGALGLHGFGVEDETAADVDEPPEKHSECYFSKSARVKGRPSLRTQALVSSSHGRKSSLLTQALLTSPVLGASLEGDEHLPTKQEVFPSPSTVTSTPSSNITTISQVAVAPLDEVFRLSDGDPLEENHENQNTKPCNDQERPQSSVEVSLGRRRCISFACAEGTSSKGSTNLREKSPEHIVEASDPQEPAQRRPCLLKFACLAKPLRPQAQHNDHADHTVSNSKSENPRPAARHTAALETASTQTPIEPLGTVPDELSVVNGVLNIPQPAYEACSESLLRQEVRSYKAPRGFEDEDEWTREKIDSRRKMTIKDTLTKENAIRKLAEEVEEEAQEDERQKREATADVYNDIDSDLETSQILPVYHLGACSDDGNESDDEGGFTESDDASDDDFTHGFWTPGLTTAATSTDHLDHIRPRTECRLPESSDEYIDNSYSDHIRDTAPRKGLRSFRLARTKQPRLREQQPNVDEFIIGTLDEDRAFHEAYLSSFEERKRSKQKMIPQDIDPSFPTSDPDDENDSNPSGDEEDDEEVDDDDNDDQVGESEAEDEPSLSPAESMGSSTTKNAVQSPRRTTERMLSRTPAERSRKPSSPAKRAPTPPPRRLFGQHGPRLRSPPPPSKRLCSPPPSRRPSPIIGRSPSVPYTLMIPELAQNPNLTSTASLPRTENPFWDQHRSRHAKQGHRSPTGPYASSESRSIAEMHDRGPVDIVLGLEHKRQRRREKYWRIHCQKAHAGKEKERKCQSGKGVERMREVGMVMQDRFRGYGQLKPRLMLSV